MKDKSITPPYTILAIQTMCDALNANGLKVKIKDGNRFDKNTNQTISEYRYISWALHEEDDNHLNFFMGRLYLNPEAFKFLKSNGYLDTGICWQCGIKYNDLNYKFTSRFNHEITYKICKNCFYKGNGLTKDLANSQNNSSGCFIATSCYENCDAEEVKILRNYRDSVLKNNFFGKCFVMIYYLISPSIARLLLRKPKLRTFIKDKILNKLILYIKYSSQESVNKISTPIRDYKMKI